MPTVSVSAPSSLNFNEKTLAPQDVGVNLFSAHAVSEKQYVHKSSIAHQPKKVTTTNRIVANTPIQDCLSYLNNSKAIKCQICIEKTPFIYEKKA